MSNSESQLFAHTGAVLTMARLVESADYANVSAKFFGAHGNEIASCAEVRDVRLQERLLETSAQLTRQHLGITTKIIGVDGLVENGYDT